MSDTRPIWKALAALVLAFGLAGFTFAQDNGGGPPAGGQGGPPPADNGGPGGGGGGGGFGGGRRFDPQQMMQMMLNRVKEDLGSSDEEWAALSPKVQSIMKLQFESRPRMGRRGGGGGPPQGAPDDQTPQNPVQKATADLRAAVNANAAADDLAKKLQALRDARTASQAELTKAQADLKALLTQRQEAQLVLDGVLE